MDDVNRKKKTPNFSASGRALLLKLANEKKHIVENKTTDAFTWKQKEEAWKKIANSFNASTTGSHRSDKQLKNKYEAIKKELKKQHSQYSAYLRGTGGGPYVKPPKIQSADEKILASTIALGIQGLTSKKDSDGLAGISGISTLEVHTEAYNIDKENVVETDWSEQNSYLLQTEKDVRLTSLNSVPESETDIPTSSAAEHDYSKTTLSQGSTWQSRRRPVIKRKKNLASASAKFETLAEKKMALVQSQQTLIDEQLMQQRKEHEKRSLLLDLQIEEQKLKNKKLKCDCTHTSENK